MSTRNMISYRAIARDIRELGTLCDSSNPINPNENQIYERLYHRASKQVRIMEKKIGRAEMPSDFKDLAYVLKVALDNEHSRWVDKKIKYLRGEAA